MLQKSNGWKLLHKKFYIYIFKKPIKPQLVYLKAYGCKAYMIMLVAQLKQKKLIKLDL